MITYAISALGVEVTDVTHVTDDAQVSNQHPLGRLAGWLNRHKSEPYTLVVSCSLYLFVALTRCHTNTLCFWSDSKGAKCCSAVVTHTYGMSKSRKSSHSFNSSICLAGKSLSGKHRDATAKKNAKIFFRQVSSPDSGPLGQKQLLQIKFCYKLGIV